jgi:hypothetical protein
LSSFSGNIYSRYFGRCTSPGCLPWHPVGIFEPTSGSRNSRSPARGRTCERVPSSPPGPTADYISQRAPREQGRPFVCLWDPWPPGKGKCADSGLDPRGFARPYRCVPAGLKGHAWEDRSVRLAGVGRAAGAVASCGLRCVTVTLRGCGAQCECGCDLCLGWVCHRD